MSRAHHTDRPHRSGPDAYRMRTQLIHGAGDSSKRWDFTHHLARSGAGRSQHTGRPPVRGEAVVDRGDKRPEEGSVWHAAPTPSSR